MTERCMRGRFEQSDEIMILLNLSYIPDVVVKKIDFKPGWSTRFKIHMIDFKVDFKKEHNCEWQYQNEELEKKYVTFYKAN